MKKIAVIYTDMPDKFGIPRQSGLVPGLRGRIVFEPEYRNPDAVRGLDGFSHIWLIWQFSKNAGKGRPRTFSGDLQEGLPQGAAGNSAEEWSPTVRPPKLGGDVRMGVFATRSPFRPNPLGLSCVKLESVSIGKGGPVLEVSGIDMADGTPIYDIKPYLPYTDSHPEAAGGFAEQYADYRLEVSVSDGLMDRLLPEHRPALMGILSNDPRPSYQHDENRIYGLTFAGFNVKFTVAGNVLTVREITPQEDKDA